MVEVMREHPEYADLWDRLDEVSDEEIEHDGVNPVLHITIHTVIENQIAIGDPPMVEKTVNTLVQKGMSRHEAVHRAGVVLLSEILEVLQNQRPFNTRRYTRNLRKLAKEAR
jgi:hypothetical protein